MHTEQYLDKLDNERQRNECSVESRQLQAYCFAELESLYLQSANSCRPLDCIGKAKSWQDM